MSCIHLVVRSWRADFPWQLDSSLRTRKMTDGTNKILLGAVEQYHAFSKQVIGWHDLDAGHSFIISNLQFYQQDKWVLLVHNSQQIITNWPWLGHLDHLWYKDPERNPNKQKHDRPTVGSHRITAKNGLMESSWSPRISHDTRTYQNPVLVELVTLPLFACAHVFFLCLCWICVNRM